MKNILSSLSLSTILSSISVALVIWMLEIFLIVSLAALLFAGPLGQFSTQGTGIMLFSGFIFTFGIALTSSFITAIALQQEVPIVVTGVMTAAIAAQMQTAGDDALFATVIVAIILSTTLTGIAFWFIGRFKLGQLVRYIPYPVIGGFMVGTGWALLVGGIGIMATTPFGPALLSPAELVRWGPGALLAITILLMTRRYAHFLLFPSLILAGGVLFYLFYFIATGSIETAGPNGWLLGPFPSESMWQPVTALALDQVNWPAIAHALPNFGAIILMSAIALLLNTSGLEVATETNADLNRELKSVGVTNILAGLAGSPVGFASMSATLVGYRLGVHTRLTGIITAVFVGLTLIFGAGVLSVIPRLIAGGLLIFLGLPFFWDWLYKAWFRLSRLDYLLIWVILLAIIFLGFLEGVGIGIGIAVILFTLNYSRIDAIRHTLTGVEQRSSAIRPLLYERLLQHRGQQIYILVLRGYLFFGTAHRLIERARTRIDNPDLPEPRFILLDFRLVTGIDSSALYAFSQLFQLAHSRQIAIVITHLSDHLQSVWEREFLQEDTGRTHHLFPNSDQGLAWCEAQIIHDFASVGLSAEPKSFLEQVEEALRRDEQPVDWLNYLRPDDTPDKLPALALLEQHMERLELAPGEIIVQQGSRATGLYILENGRAIIQTNETDGQASISNILGNNVIIGVEELYTQQPFTATIITDRPSTLLYLSQEAIKQVETNSPTVAIVIHRILAASLGDQLTRANQLVKALQR
jgi:SulP family sulfate permease